MASVLVRRRWLVLTTVVACAFAGALVAIGSDASIAGRVLPALLIGAVAGPVVGLAVERLEPTVRTTLDAETVTGIRVLAVVPQAGRPLPAPGAANDAWTGLFDRLRDEVVYASGGERPRALLVTAPEAGAGKSTVAAHLAARFAADGARTLLLEADLRRPGVGELVSSPNAGLVAYLSGRLPAGRLVETTDVPNLSVVVAGEPSRDAFALLVSDRMHRLLAQQASGFDLVVMEGPPVLPSAEGLLLAGLSDAVLMVVRAGRTRRDLLRTALRDLRSAGGRPIGVVLNGGRQEAPGKERPQPSDELVRQAMARGQIADDRERAAEREPAAVAAPRDVAEPEPAPPAQVTAAPRNPLDLLDGGSVLDATSLAALETELTPVLGVASGPAEQARHLALLACALTARRSAEERIGELCDEATSLARETGDERLLADVLEMCAAARWSPSNAAERADVASELASLAESTGDERMAERASHLRQCALLELGEIGAAERELQAHERACARQGEPARSRHLVHAAVLSLLAGRYDDAESDARAAVDAAAETIGAEAADAFGLSLAVVAWERGRIGEVESTLARLDGRYPSLDACRAALALVHAELGRRDEASAALDPLLTRLTSAARGRFWLASACLLAKACWLLGDAMRAGVLDGLLEPFAELNAVAGPGLVSLGSVARYRALAAATAARFDEASRSFDIAQRRNEAMLAEPWIARTCAEYASLLIARAASPDRASELAGRAYEISRRLGIRDATTTVVMIAVRHLARIDRLWERAWTDVVRDAELVVRGVAARHAAYVFKSGSGWMLVLSSPWRAVRCVSEIHEATRVLEQREGIGLRFGVEVMDGGGLEAASSSAALLAGIGDERALVTPAVRELVGDAEGVRFGEQTALHGMSGAGHAVAYPIAPAS